MCNNKLTRYSSSIHRICWYCRVVDKIACFKNDSRGMMPCTAILTSGDSWLQRLPVKNIYFCLYIHNYLYNVTIKYLLLPINHSVSFLMCIYWHESSLFINVSKFERGYFWFSNKYFTNCPDFSCTRILANILTHAVI